MSGTCYDDDNDASTLFFFNFYFLNKTLKILTTGASNITDTIKAHTYDITALPKKIVNTIKCRICIGPSI